MGPSFHNFGFPACNKCYHNTCPQQHLYSMPVPDMKGFVLVSSVVKNDTSVRQYPVNIEDKKLDIVRYFSNICFRFFFQQGILVQKSGVTPPPCYWKHNMKNRLSRNILSVKIILSSFLLLIYVSKTVVVVGDVSKEKKDKRH